MHIDPETLWRVTIEVAKRKSKAGMPFALAHAYQLLVTSGVAEIVDAEINSFRMDTAKQRREIETAMEAINLAHESIEDRRKEMVDRIVVTIERDGH